MRERRLSQETVTVTAPSLHCQSSLRPVSWLQGLKSKTTRMAEM